MIFKFMITEEKNFVLLREYHDVILAENDSGAYTAKSATYVYRT